MSTVTMGGNPVNVAGNFPQKGQSAPDFKLVGKDLKDVSLADFAGKRKVLNIVPSLDTAVCATSARKFNEKAAGLANTVVATISADFLVAMSVLHRGHRTCAASVMAAAGSNNYGVRLTGGPLAGGGARRWCWTRTTVLRDWSNPQQPNYDAALAALVIPVGLIRPFPQRTRS
jgi:thiol peroxidase